MVQEQSLLLMLPLACCFQNYVWLSLIRVGVDDGRDLRVVIDVVLGLITCGSG